MDEPTLEDISDYNGLTGKKKKGVTLVIIAGLIIGLGYVAVNYFLGSVDDSLNVFDNVKTVPYK